jgi:hypothetical protein
VTGIPSAHVSFTKCRRPAAFLSKLLPFFGPVKLFVVGLHMVRITGNYMTSMLSLHFINILLTCVYLYIRVVFIIPARGYKHWRLVKRLV